MAISIGSLPGPGVGSRFAATPLVGRDEELTLLGTALGRSWPVTIKGEAGVGKTHLVRAALEASGVKATVVGCNPIQEESSLGPVADLVLRAAELAGSEALQNPILGALRPLVPELERALPPAPEALEGQTAERSRMFRAIVGLLASMGRCAVVIEDVHWCDRATASFITYLVAHRPHELSLILTYREEDLPRDSEIARALTFSRRDPASIELALAPLSIDGVRMLCKGYFLLTRYLKVSSNS